MEEPVKSPLEQLNDVSDGVKESWQHVVDVLKEATYEHLPDMSDEDRLMLEESFWSAHPEILKRAESYEPGVAKKIILRFEVLSQQRRDAEMQELENVMLPRVRGRNFLRAIMGLPGSSKAL